MDTKQLNKIRCLFEFEIRTEGPRDVFKRGLELLEYIGELKAQLLAYADTIAELEAPKKREEILRSERDDAIADKVRMRNDRDARQSDNDAIHEQVIREMCAYNGLREVGAKEASENRARIEELKEEVEDLVGQVRALDTELHNVPEEE